MRAWFAAVEYYNEHPEESSAIIAEYYGITPEEYRDDVSGLVWPDYAYQADERDLQKNYEVFSAIARVKSMNNRIPRVPKAAGAFDWGLLRTLYEK